jgi:hypothetical protein
LTYGQKNPKDHSSLRLLVDSNNSVSVDINVTENSGKNNIRPNNHKVFVNFDNLEDKVL